MPAMPLGLACVVEATRNAGHDVTMLDLMFEMDAAAVLKKMITEFRPECIGISVRNIDDQNIETPRFLLDKVKEVVALCRDQVNVPVVLGGAGYSMFPESALAYLDADMGIEGEGEIAFPALLARLENNSDLSGIPGLYARDHGSQQPKTLAKNLDELTPKLEQIPVANIENEIASTEDDCFICKNKIKENRKLKTQQQSEQVVPTKTEIEQLEDLDEEPNDEINFLNEILKQFQGLFKGMFS